MDFETWIRIGLDNNWCDNIGCWSHGWQPSVADDDPLNDGFDSCITVMQVQGGYECAS